MAEDWDQDGGGGYMEDDFSGGGEGQPTDSLEVFTQPTDSLEVFATNSAPRSVSNVLAEHQSSGPLSPQSQKKMSRSIVEIFELEEEPVNEDEEMGEADDEEPVVDLEDRRRRTDRLRDALPTVAQLWWSDSDQIVLVAEKLGDGSRDRKLSLFVTVLSLSAPAEGILYLCFGA